MERAEELHDLCATHVAERTFVGELSVRALVTCTD
jgi:hypothetical protein